MTVPTDHTASNDERVVLLDDAGGPIGTARKADVHGSDTPLHLAFSCYVFDDAGRVLLTRRALTKATWPGVWTNSFCGHPAPGEDPRAAVSRRLGQELGAAATELQCVLPTFRYRAVDASGVVENEICPVWTGRLATALSPDPAEIMQIAWIPWDALVEVARSASALLSPWSVLQIPLLDAEFSREETA